MTDSNTKTPASDRPPYAVAKLRRPKGACYCDHDDEECYRRKHWEAVPVDPSVEWPDNALDSF